MSSLIARIQADIKTAMKAGEAHKVETLRGLSSDLKYRKIQLGADLLDADVVGVLRQAAKRRREAAEAFRKGGREDLTVKEESELAIIETYLPPDLSDSDLDGLIRAAIAETGAKGVQELGKVMSTVMPKVAGLAEGNRVRSRVQALLSG